MAVGRSFSWLCVLVVLVGCAKRIERESVHELGMMLEMPAPTGAQTAVSGLVVWQGWFMRWQYNHRLNRTGSLIEQLPCRVEPSQGPRVCRGRVISSAASGTGTDVAELGSYFALIAARGVSGSSGSVELVVEGFEGELLEATGELDVPVDDTLARAEVRVALLSGFDLASLGSADKLKSLRIEGGDPAIVEGRARVPVRLAGVLDCSSMECPRTNVVNLSVLVGVTVVGGPERWLRVEDVPVAAKYSWDKKEELPRESTRTGFTSSSEAGESVFAIRGFQVDVKRDLHVLDFGLQVERGEGDGHTASLEFRNWREGMKKSRPPMSWFSYKEEGEAEWTTDIVRLDFDSALVSRRAWTTQLSWEGEGRPSLAPEAERFRMLYWEIRP